jgi:hypothetical protein
MMTFFQISLHQTGVQDYTGTISKENYFFDTKELGRKQGSEVTISMTFEWFLSGESDDLVLHGFNC